MNKEKLETGLHLGLKIYEFTEQGVSGWVVSGTSKKEGKRWRRRFLTKEKAEEFLEREVWRLQGAKRDGQGSMDDEAAVGVFLGDEIERAGSRSHSPWSAGEGDRAGSATYRKGRGEWGVAGGVFVLLAVFLGFVIDVRMRGVQGNEGDGKVMATDFETNPLLSGWLSVGSGAEWTNAEHVSGQRAIVVRQATWVSGVVPSEQLSWYRLIFRSNRWVQISLVSDVRIKGCF